MCDQYDHRGCEIVDGRDMIIDSLVEGIADLKSEIVEDLTTKYDNDPTWTLQKIIEKWVAK